MIEIYTEEDDIKSYMIPLLRFEKLHPKELRMGKKDREQFFNEDEGKGVWLYVNGVLLGEILWNDGDKNDDKTAYIVGFSVVKSHQGKGFGLFLKQILYNILKNRGYNEVRGHARDGKSWDITKKLGGKRIQTFPDYHDTGEKYHYYKQKLN